MVSEILGDNLYKDVAAIIGLDENIKEKLSQVCKYLLHLYINCHIFHFSFILEKRLQKIVQESENNDNGISFANQRKGERRIFQ